ncbi:MAG: molecular chaperone TorD family protein [Nitrospirota bacterium]
MTKKMIETAKQRSNIYGLLSLIYRAEINMELLNHIKEPGFLAVLSEMGAGLGDDFMNRPEEDLIEDLAVEYTRLFLGPGKHISPHESIHHERDDGDWGQFWGKSTVEIKKFIETAGLEYKDDFTGLPDHISVELEFMQKASAREAQAREEGSNDELLYCLKMERKFIDEHLLKWVPVFCDKIISEAELSFYREIAKVTKHFMEFEEEEISKYISEAEKAVNQK